MFKKVVINKNTDRTRFSPALQLRVYPAEGERVPVIGGYSEVMMHFGLCGKPIEIELLERKGCEATYYSAQIWVDGKPFSFSVTCGEAGFYCDCWFVEEPEFYCYADYSRVDPRRLFEP